LNPTTQKKLNKYAELAISTRETVYNTYELAKQCITEGISGDFVECGVFAGSQIAAMALACQTYKNGRSIHAFDSFEGIPAAGVEDGEAGKKIEFKSACSLDEVKRFMEIFEVDQPIIYHKGWFEDTVPACEIDRIALLRLDGDLYSSTKVCLENLYPLLVKGGFLIIDDYLLPGCKKAVDEYFEDGTIFESIKGGKGPVWLKRS
jgi:hypothetical protein